MTVKRKFGRVPRIYSMMFLKGAKSGRTQTVTHLPDEAVPHQQDDLGVVLSALQAGDRSIELSANLDRFVCLSRQYGVLEAPNGTKHVRPYESRLDIAWRL